LSAATFPGTTLQQRHVIDEPDSLLLIVAVTSTFFGGKSQAEIHFFAYFRLFWEGQYAAGVTILLDKLLTHTNYRL